MSVKDFLKERKSTREFKDKEISTQLLNTLERKLNDLSSDKNFIVSFKLLRDGKYVFEKLNGHAGYSGVMIRSPHYIAIVEHETGDSATLRSAFVMEEAISLLSEEGISSCYVTIGSTPDEIQQKVFGVDHSKIRYVFAIGYPDADLLDLERPVGTRLSIEEMVFKDEPDEPCELAELENIGLMEIFYYTRLTPSTMNLQPWRFIVKNYSEVLLITNKSKIQSFTYVDLGIVMYYFYELARHTGLQGEWKIEESDVEMGDYKLVARYKL